MRVGLEALVRFGNADQLQQLQSACRSRLAAQAFVQGQHLVDLLLDAVQRVQRGHGLLKDHGDAVAANAAQFVLVQFEQVLSGVVNAAAGVLGQRVGQQTQDGVRGD